MPGSCSPSCCWRWGILLTVLAVAAFTPLGESRAVPGGEQRHQPGAERGTELRPRVRHRRTHRGPDRHLPGRDVMLHIARARVRAHLMVTSRARPSSLPEPPRPRGPSLGPDTERRAPVPREEGGASDSPVKEARRRRGLSTRAPVGPDVAATVTAPAPRRISSSRRLQKPEEFRRSVRGGPPGRGRPDRGRPEVLHPGAAGRPGQRRHAFSAPSPRSTSPGSPSDSSVGTARSSTTIPARHGGAARSAKTTDSGSG